MHRCLGGAFGMTRLSGRAATGERVLDAVPHRDGPHVTKSGALSLQGIDAVLTVEGATEAEVLLPDVEHVLAPTLRPDDMVIMDTLRAHQGAGVPHAREGRGARLLSWPPSAPDLSPIEPCWSKRKVFLHVAKARTREALDVAITRALATVTAAHACGWFAYGGDALQ